MDLEERKLLSQLLDTSLSPEQQEELRKLADRSRERKVAGVQLDMSLVKYLRDDEMEAILKVVEEHKQALSELPDGFYYHLHATGDFGNYLESGWACLHIDLYLPDGDGSPELIEQGYVHAWKGERENSEIKKYLSSRFEKIVRLAQFL